MTMNHPVFLLMAAAVIFMSLYNLQERSPHLLPAIFVLSLAGLVVRMVQILRERRRRRDSRAVVDFERLHRADLAPRVSWIKENLRGHDETVDRVAARIQRNLSIAVPNRTLGAFLLVGPTGTGKTYLGELFAKAIYPDSSPLVLRMNQYKDHEDVSTLIGPPPGYQGYEIGGALTRPVIENPYRVVILDEFEKSHPDVRHCFFDILDRGQCAEKSSGKTAHFAACVFFATCNAGVEALRAIWGETADPAARAGRARDALAREDLDKALLARFDGITLMDRLKPVVVAEVACLQLAAYWRQYGIEVTYAAPEVLAETLRQNVEFQDYGVRQLARLIQESTSPFIEQARRGGARRVRLDLDRSSGRLKVLEA